ncbi:DNA primase [Clostridium brassicae]|uniref:DNA primase n=1 Tax=Clostridium brassicae TaxID=2999072 RepID=A0ABT4DDI2_9CLOT|nr:DNA primase [Clostridium brassicae]MCY6959688.1 DNA primase [Clostridium brassicae]
MISEEVIQKIKEQNDIVDIISESVQLKRAGRNFTGLCPFHHEKTPSFSVSPDKQIYKCFGCGEAGNVITFIMKTKNISFVETLKYLAERANIDVNFGDKTKVENNKHKKIYKINVDAARYYFACLQNDKKVIEYFIGRGIKNSTIRRFGLGYAPKGWSNITNYLKKKGYSELDLLNAGLITKGKNNSYYDRFRERVMFPVFDYKGRVIGFGGRVLDDSKPKYLNSPETEVFKKGTNLYGLNFANRDLKDRTLIIVEGYMDCISLHQYGITNVVASLGTALTSQQAKLLKRYADRVIISYDSDSAGKNATIRGLDILRKEGFDLKVLSVPQGKDPDEFVRNNGKDAFLQLIDKAMPFIDYRIERAKEGLNLKNGEMLAAYIKKVCNIVSELDPITMDVYIKKVSEETGVNEQAIYDSLSNKNQRNVKNSQNMYSESAFRQKLYLEPGFIKAERNLLKTMLQSIDAYRYVKENIEEEELILDSHKKIFNLIIETKNNKTENDEIYIEARCNDIESSKEWTKIVQSSLVDSDNYKELINDYMREIKKYKLEESKKEVMNKIKLCEEKGLFEESLQLVKQFQEIEEDIMKITNNERR